MLSLLLDKKLIFVRSTVLNSFAKLKAMPTIQIKSNLSIEELIGNLSQLDTPTLNYLVTSLRKVQLARKQPEASTMPEEAFWNFIEKIDWKQKEDSRKVAPLVNALATADSATIYQFSERLAYLLHQLDGPAFAKSLEKDELGFSADTFLYARCLVVAKGQAYYQEVLKQPTNMPIGKDFEALLSVAEQAYFKKTGKAYAYIPTINYESFFNQELWGENAIVL